MARNHPPRTPLAVLVAAFLGFGCGQETQTLPVVKTATGEMVLVPAGWFTMGSERGQTDEAPKHRVWIDAFLMDRFEVTQEQFKGILKKGHPFHFKADRNPAENVSWAVAALFCNARSRSEGLRPCYDEKTGACDFDADGYRLPTEAEWEYACRAGSRSEYFFGNDARPLQSYAWLRDNSGRTTHPVGSRRPNPWGLYDLYGNVSEWCNDVYGAGYSAEGPSRNPRGPTEADSSRFVVRGGAWNSSAEACRSASRVGESPGQVDGCFARNDIGFRCVRKAPESGDSRKASQESVRR